MHARRLAILGLFVSFVVSAPLVAATLPEGTRPGAHVVRPGDTLRSLAQRYLGSQAYWTEIAKLNPEIADPDRILPGQRIRILVAPALAQPAAQVQRLARRVEERPAPIPWGQAQLGDVLVERDGVRTYPKSSTELRFTDGTRLAVTEDSLIFLRRTGGALAGVEKKAVEIIEGQAEIEAQNASAAKPAEVEILIGNARAKTATNEKGVAQTRARKPTSGGAKVMVYGGKGQVEAGGSKVELPEGTGSSVADKGAPSPAEKLLPPPNPAAPLANAVLAIGTAQFRWEPVAGAASYQVEVCRDTACGEVVERVVDWNTTEWTAPALALGEYYWRATARSASGLDGYPSTSTPFQAVAAIAARPTGAPPSAALALAGTQVRIHETLFGNGETQIEVQNEIVPCPPVTRRQRLDGAEIPAWKPLAETAEGPHSAELILADACGQETVVGPFAFSTDTQPPVLEVAIVGLEQFDSHGEPEEERRVKPRPWSPQRGGALAWTVDGRRWLSLPWGSPLGTDADGIYFEKSAAGDHPQIFLLGKDTSITSESGDTTVPEGKMLWISAKDDGSGVSKMKFRTRTAPAGSGGAVFEVEVEDLVGNVRKMSWRLAPR